MAGVAGDRSNAFSNVEIILNIGLEEIHSDNIFGFIPNALLYDFANEASDWETEYCIKRAEIS